MYIYIQTYIYLSIYMVNIFFQISFSNWCFLHVQFQMWKCRVSCSLSKPGRSLEIWADGSKVTEPLRILTCLYSRVGDPCRLHVYQEAPKPLYTKKKQSQQKAKTGCITQWDSEHVSPLKVMGILIRPSVKAARILLDFQPRWRHRYTRGVKLIFTRGYISLTVAFKGPNVILGLYKCKYSWS